MKTAALSKHEQVASWVQGVSKTKERVLVSNYCYNCYFSNDPKAKTLIVFPDNIENKGVIAINKPLDQVELIDVIKLYKTINSKKNSTTSTQTPEA